MKHPTSEEVEAALAKDYGHDDVIRDLDIVKMELRTVDDRFGVDAAQERVAEYVATLEAELAALKAPASEKVEAAREKLQEAWAMMEYAAIVVCDASHLADANRLYHAALDTLIAATKPPQEVVEALYWAYLTGGGDTYIEEHGRLCYCPLHGRKGQHSTVCDEMNARLTALLPIIRGGGTSDD